MEGKRTTMLPQSIPCTLVGTTIQLPGKLCRWGVFQGHISLFEGKPAGWIPSPAVFPRVMWRWCGGGRKGPGVEAGVEGALRGLRGREGGATGPTCDYSRMQPRVC